MKKMHLPSRLLSMLLVLALLCGFAAPVGAAGSSSTGLSLTQVDNSAVSASLQEQAVEEPEEADYADTDMVRVSIVMETASTVGAGFATEDIAHNNAAMSYRAGLVKEQSGVQAKIEKATGEKLDVVWNLTLAANIISANVAYGQIPALEKIPGVAEVVIETRYEPDVAETDLPVDPNMGTSCEMIGSPIAWTAGYTGAGSRVAIIDTGLDTDHQSFDEGAFRYSLSQQAEAAGIEREAFTSDWHDVVTDPAVDIVVELIGGTGVARTFVLEAMKNGASVVTANKALLAKYGPELYKTAEDNNVDIYFEAAVGGAIPIVRPLRESLVGDQVKDMLGIVNGTTNYILDEMTTKGLDFDVALKDAQAKGYAEADPTGDIEGYDAANKAAIMATLGFHTNVGIDDVTVEGITRITADDIAAATAEGRVIKLLAVVDKTDDGVSARVYPALIKQEHPLASVRGSFNAVFLRAEYADDLMFYGRGAGGAPTASAVVGDIVTVARHIAAGCTGPAIRMYNDYPIAPLSASKAAFAVRFLIHDNPGVLAKISAVFAKNGVSINGVNQDLKPTLKDPGYDGEIQQLRLVTHMTDENTLRATVAEVCELDCVTGEPSILRVLD